MFFLWGYVELQNDSWRFWAGQDPDAIGRQNTNSPSWTTHKMSGNFGQIRPGIRLERYFQLTNMLRSSVYLGLTQQFVVDFIADQQVAGTDNGWPNVEFRWQVDFGEEWEGQHPLMFAIGGLIGETRAVDQFGLSLNNISTSWAVIPELHIRLGRLGFQGEAFAGDAIGTYNGAIGQSLNPQDGDAIYRVGGFGEFYYKLTDWFTISIGYGIDDPRDSDLGVVGGVFGQRSRNETYWLNFIWRLSDQLETRFEVSQQRTNYVAPSTDSEATIFHSLVRYSF